MQKKDYQKIAGVVGSLISGGALALDDARDCERLAVSFIDMLKADNPAFDEVRFRIACGLGEHIPQWCERANCDEEAVRWYEEGSRTVYVCLEHDDVAESEEGGTGMIKNAKGKMVELGIYACSQTCGQCNQ